MQFRSALHIKYTCEKLVLFVILEWLSLLLQPVAASGPNDDYLYTASALLGHVVHGETKLVEYLNTYIAEEERALERIKRFSKKCHENQRFILQEGVGKLMHPVKIFSTTERLINEFELVKRIMRESTAIEFLDDMQIHSQALFGTVMPTEKDLSGAAGALFRLQDTYNLKAKDLADGVLPGSVHTEKFTALNCFELGRTAYIKLRDYYHSVIWLQEALRRFNTEDPPTVKEEVVLDFLSNSLYAQGNLERALYSARRLRKLAKDHPLVRPNIALFKEELRAQGKNTNEIALNQHDLPPLVNLRPNDGHVPNRDGYEALCRGENQDLNEQSDLHCYYKRDTHYSKIAPFKVEIMRMNEPRIVMFHNIITDAELQMLTALAEPKFFTVPTFLKFRVSKSAWVADDEDELVMSVSKRLEEATGLSMKSAERLHLSNYGIGGHYEPHFDWYENSKEHRASFSNVIPFGNRLATVLLYLSQPVLGGATVFVELNLTLYPVKNAAAFWYNLHHYGKGDQMTRHAACPVLVGTKWIANKWIHEHGNEFRRPCRRKK